MNDKDKRLSRPEIQKIIGEQKLDIFDKRKRYREVKHEAKILSDQIYNVERNCNHSFGEPENDPHVVREALPGTTRLDRENSHGSDPVFKCSYGDVTKQRWKRTCSKCGKIETTKRKKLVGCGLKREVPDFGN